MSYDDFLIEFETFIDLKSKEQLKILDQIIPPSKDRLREHSHFKKL